jgi:hypothetical protein
MGDDLKALSLQFLDESTHPFAVLSEPAAAELEEQAAQATLRRIGAISTPGSHP